MIWEDINQDRVQGESKKKDRSLLVITAVTREKTRNYDFTVMGISGKYIPS